MDLSILIVHSTTEAVFLGFMESYSKIEFGDLNTEVIIVPWLQTSRHDLHSCTSVDNFFQIMDGSAETNPNIIIDAIALSTGDGVVIIDSRYRPGSHFLFDRSSLLARGGSTVHFGFPAPRESDCEDDFDVINRRVCDNYISLSEKHHSSWCSISSFNILMRKRIARKFELQSTNYLTPAFILMDALYRAEKIGISSNYVPRLNMSSTESLTIRSPNLERDYGKFRESHSELLSGMLSILQSHFFPLKKKDVFKEIDSMFTRIEVASRAIKNPGVVKNDFKFILRKESMCGNTSK